MGFFARLKTGWALAMDSLDFLRRDPELVVFPFVRGIAGIVYLAVLFGGRAVLPGGGGIGFYVFLFVVYFGSTFIASFYRSADQAINAVSSGA